MKNSNIYWNNMHEEIIQVKSPLCIMTMFGNKLKTYKSKHSLSIKGVCADDFPEGLKKFLFLKKLEIVQKKCREVRGDPSINPFTLDILVIDNMKQLHDFIDVYKASIKNLSFEIEDLKVWTSYPVSEQQFLNHIKTLDIFDE